MHRLAITLCAIAIPVYAQRILGEFTGTVVDPTSAAVTGAKVTVTETATQRQFTGVTNESGVYRITSVPAGSAYEIRVEAAGFRALTQSDVRLDVGEVRRLDFNLEVGAVTETITVSDAVNALSLEKGEVSAVVGQRQIVDLPLNGRNVYQLAELQPGVVRVSGSGLQDSDTTDARVGAGGARYRDNQILLDGVTNNNDRQGGRTTITLSPDAVQQFRVVTNAMSAEYGRSGGALISVITRGGTNELHGSAFWYLRNDNLDASTTFEARAGQPEFRRNQFGGSLGGPIVKNHLFYFFSYQGLRQTRPSITEFTVETPQFRDFVLRTRPNSLAARLLRDFPPVADPVNNIRDIGSPAPGVQVAGPPDGIPDLGEVAIPVAGSTNDDQYSIRIDQTFNEGRDTITGRYTLNDRVEVRPGDNSARVFATDFLEKDQNVSLNFSHIFSPSMINDFRAGWNYDPQINVANYPEVPHVQMNVVGRSASQFSQTFGYVFPLDFRLHTYHLYDAVSITRGNHGLRIGGEYRWFQENSEFAQFTKPLVSFHDIMDFADDEVLTMQARVDPATGLPSGTYRHFRQKEFGFFIQDDWKVTPRLTLNLGLRYDNFGPLKEKNDLLSTLLYPAGGGLAQARVAQVDSLWARDNNDLAPRLGLAWDPTGSAKWAIRAGGGLFYNRIWSNFSGNVRFNPPFSMPVTLSALTPGQNPSAAYRIPFVGDPGFARPLDALGGSAALRPSVQTVDVAIRTPYVWQWFAGVQRQLPGGWMGEVNYIGSAGRKLLFRNEQNRFNGDRADGALNRVNQSFTSILHGNNAVSSIYNGLTAQAQRRFAQGYSVQVAYTFSRSIDTDSEPFGGGPGEAVGSMDVTNLRLDRGLSAFDATHRLAANFVWELPFLRGPGIVPSVFGGWQFNGIVSLQSGFPFTVWTSEDYNLDGAFLDRPNAVTDLRDAVGKGPAAFLNGAFGDRSGWGGLFRPAPAGTQGTLGRNTFRGPGYASVDFSLLKSFRMPWLSQDGARWEFRAEAFNIFNRVNLRSPGNSLGAYNASTGLWSSATFGRSTLAFDPRQIQLALRFAF